jgi:hypothetical protein
VINYRDLVISSLKHMGVIHQIRNGEKEFTIPAGTNAMACKVAELTLEYFKEKVFVYSHVFRKTGVRDDPRVMDTIRYAHSRGHPLLLLLTAESETIKTLAAYNARMAMSYMPWIETIWGNLLPQDWERPAKNIKELFDGEPHYWWPLDPWSTPYFVGDRRAPKPEHLLNAGIPDQKTDSYLLGIRDQRMRS